MTPPGNIHTGLKDTRCLKVSPLAPICLSRVRHPAGVYVLRAVQEGGLVPGASEVDVPDSFARNRVRVSWIIYAIAASGLLINLVYFGIESRGERPFFDRFFSHPLEHGFIVSLILVTPLIAFITRRIFASYRMSERSRALELEVAARTRELEDLKGFSENIMASVNDVIFVIGSDGRFQFVSGDCEAVLGFQPETLMGRQFSDIVAPGALAIAVSNFEKVMWGHEVQPYELSVVDGDGRSRHVEISGTAYKEGDKVIAQVGVARDITERKNLEQHIFERNRELAALNAVSSAVGQSLDLDQILSAALDQVVELFTAHRACVHLYDADNEVLDLRVWRGGSAGFLRRISTIKPGRGSGRPGSAPGRGPGRQHR